MVLKKYFIVLFALMLVACGFHPRGVIIDGSTGGFSNFSGTTFFIATNNFDSYANDLRKRLIAYKAKVVKDDEDADYIINLQDLAKNSQLTGIVGGATNNTYLLKLTLAYNIVKPDVEEPIIPNKKLSAQQFWQSNAAIVLSQSNEANRQYRYIQSQLINNMINQMAALLPDKDSLTDTTKKSTKKSKSTKSIDSAKTAVKESYLKDDSKSENI